MVNKWDALVNILLTENKNPDQPILIGIVQQELSLFYLIPYLCLYLS